MFFFEIFPWPPPFQPGKDELVDFANVTLEFWHLDSSSRKQIQLLASAEFVDGVYAGNIANLTPITAAGEGHDGQAATFDTGPVAGGVQFILFNVSLESAGWYKLVVRYGQQPNINALKELQVQGKLNRSCDLYIHKTISGSTAPATLKLVALKVFLDRHLQHWRNFKFCPPPPVANF